MTTSIFAEPSAHRVEDIKAEFTRPNNYSCCLTLKLSGVGCEGEFEIYGADAAIASKLEAVATLINAVFNHHTEDENAKVHNDLMTHLYGTDSWRNEL